MPDTLNDEEIVETVRYDGRMFPTRAAAEEWRERLQHALAYVERTSDMTPARAKGRARMHAAYAEALLDDSPASTEEQRPLEVAA